MALTTLDKLLWATDAVLNLALFVVLLYRRRYRVLPWFTAWIAFGSLFTLVLFVALRFGSQHLYALCYWSGAVLDLLFQIAVVIEMGRIVLRRSGRWVEGAKGRFAAMALIGTAVAAVLAWSVKPAATDRFDVLAIRGNLFTAVLICILFTAVIAASQHFGLGWRTYVMREGYGLTIWALTGFAVEALHGYFGSVRHFHALEHLRNFVYDGALLYWAIALWVPERQPRTRTPAERKQYQTLRNEVEFAQSGSSPTDRAVRK